MHRSTPRRSPRSRWSRSCAVLLIAIAVVGLGGCGGDDRPQPTLSTVNFTPKLIITIADHHLVMSKGPRDDGAVVVGGPTEATVPAGTVIDVVNDGPGSHRLQGDIVFDTGILRAGERTTIVLTNDSTAEKRIVVSDPTDAAMAGAITVRPKPAT